MTLIEFLRARLEDQRESASRLLRAARDNALAVQEPRQLGRPVPGWHDWREVEQMAREVLAAVEAKRRIIYVAERERQDDYLFDQARVRMMDDVFKLLALPYVDHPDYDQDWKP